METTRCPYCHENIQNNLLKDHIAEHRKLMPDGQQKDYVTLPEEDRDAGDLTGVPVTYIHRTCGVGTRMPDEIVRSYLKNPYLYLADTTFCCGCNKQVPYTECTWSPTGENLQTYFDNLRAAKPEYRPAGFGNPLTTAAPNTTKAADSSSSFSIGRVLIGLAVVVLASMAAKLPRVLMKNAAQPPAAATNNDGLDQAADQWGEKIKRGEDVPEPILILAGIKPDDYKQHQVQLRMRKLEQQEKYSDVVDLLDTALLESPESLFLHNSKAWLLATCKDDTVRNGKLAVEHATKACEATEFHDPTYLDTLAAACAEAADFEAAVKHGQAAMELTDDDAQRARFAARLDLYKNQQPYHK